VKKRNLRIMILTARFGDGHLQASRALKQSFLDQGIEDVKVIDLLQESHPVLNTISRSPLEQVHQLYRKEEAKGNYTPRAA
jgi:UDP-N-acetylglucosamine:LPS N-acetylglucosamine transferase